MTYVAGVCGLLLVAGAEPVSASQGPRARVDEPVYEFGEVSEGDVVEHAFVIHNDGDETLELTSVRAGCGCTATEYDRQIAPGESGRVKAAFDTRGRGNMTRSPVHVTTNDPQNARLSLALHGTIRRIIEIQPAVGANFGRVDEGPIEPRVVKVISNADEPIRLTRLPDPRQPTGHEHFETEIVEREPGKVFEVTVTPRQPIPTGATAVPLRFDPGVEGMTHLVIPCRVFLPPPVEVNPQVIFLAEPPLADMSRPIDVIFNEEGEFEVTSVTSSDDRVEVKAEEIVAGKRVRVMCAIPAGFDLPPQRFVEITITTNFPAQSEIKVPIRMRPQPRAPHQPAQPSVSRRLLGRHAPQATLRTVDDQRAMLRGDSTEVTALMFWSVRCPHSEDHLPMVARLAETYAPRGVAFRYISIDEQTPPDEIAVQVDALGIQQAVLLDEDARVHQAFHQPPVPSLILVGKSGFVEALHVGAGGDEDAMGRLESRISAELDLLLEGKGREEFPSTDGSDDESALTIVQPRIETGQHKPGERVQTVVSYRNTSRQPLRVAYVSGTRGITVLDGFTEELAPGRAGTARVEFQVPDVPGRFAMHALLATDDGSHASRVATVTGTVRPYIEFTPAAGIDFTRNPRVHRTPRIAMFIAHGPGEVRFEGAEATTPNFTAELAQLDESRARLTVRAVPPFEEGEHQAEIHVRTNHPRQPIVRVPVKLIQPPRVEVLPSEITILDEPRVRRAGATLRHNGEGSMRILNVSSSHEQLEPQIQQRQEGLQYQLIVTVPADFESGAEAVSITVETDLPELPTVTIPIRFHTAIQPAAGPAEG